MSASDRHIERFAEFELDLSARQLIRGTRAVRLEPRAFDTLAYLSELPGRLVNSSTVAGRRTAAASAEQSFHSRQRDAYACVDATARVCHAPAEEFSRKKMKVIA